MDRGDRAANGGGRLVWLATGCGAGVPHSALLVTTKSQHALLGIPLWFFLLYVIGAGSGKGSKVLLWAAACIVPLAIRATLQTPSDREKHEWLCSIVFARILPESSAPAEDLKLLGLDPEFVRYIGAWGQRQPDNPLENQRLADALTPQVQRRAVLFYITHPWRTARILYRVLKGDAAARQPDLIGNYQRASGEPAGTTAHAFAHWTKLRSFLFRVAPWHMVLLYVLLGVGAVYCIARASSQEARRISLVCLLLFVLGLMAFGIASLADYGETGRHLWLFHVITDITIVVGAAELCRGRARWPKTTEAVR